MISQRYALLILISTFCVYSSWLFTLISCQHLVGREANKPACKDLITKNKTHMAKSKSSKGSNMQTLFVGVSIVMLILLIFAVRSCSSSEGDYSMVGEAEARQNYSDSWQTHEE